MTAEILVLSVFPLLLALAAAWDLTSFTIPNFISVSLLGIFAVYALASGISMPALGAHLLAGTIGLAAGFALFSLGYIGGGDAKLFASALLWLGLGDILQYALVASLLGGALTLAILSLRMIPLPALLANQSWIQRLHDARSGIPYGVALSSGALAVLPYSEIFHAATRI